MGLSISHNCWDGAYSSFHRWRTKICEAAGFPPLDYMEGFCDINVTDKTLIAPYTLDDLPIMWASVRQTPLVKLLHHSDCDGILQWKDCKGIADELEKCLPFLPEEDAVQNWKERTERFIQGLRAAYKAKENVEFH